MTRLPAHREAHNIGRIGWLRAAILGANDGIVSTASLIVGVAAAGAARNSILVSGIAGLVAGAMSMAAGEYVSVSSQADTEKADLAREQGELLTQPESELAELTAIYVGRGLTPALAAEVARQFTDKDAIGTHARDELGISDATAARPVLAAVTSALSFTLGAIFPVIVVLIVPGATLAWTVSLASLVFLALLGAIGARAGGANIMIATTRVAFWGCAAMAVTAGIGALFGRIG